MAEYELFAATTVNAIQHQTMKMYVEVERRTKALHEADPTAPPLCALDVGFLEQKF